MRNKSMELYLIAIILYCIAIFIDIKYLFNATAVPFSALQLNTYNLFKKYIYIYKLAF